MIRAGERNYEYDSNGNIICEYDGSQVDCDEKEEGYYKINKEGENKYSTDYGWGLLKEDKNKNGRKNGRHKRNYKWNERNQLISSVDENYSTAYMYGQDGQRTNKYTENAETIYFNKMWTLHADSGNIVYGGQYAKKYIFGRKPNSNKTPIRS